MRAGVLRDTLSHLVQIKGMASVALFQHAFYSFLCVVYKWRVPDAFARSGRASSAFFCSKIEGIFFWLIYFKKKLPTNTAHRPARRNLFEFPAALSSPQS
jgi:hypothetical protein